MTDKTANRWNNLALDIEATVDEAYRRLRTLSDETVAVRPNPGDWSVKEIFGHLVDSASNNHQRFVRLQVTDALRLPDYSQDNEKWVSIQHYQNAQWDRLLDMWRFFNLHIAHVVRSVDEACIDHVWVVNEDISYSLGDLMIDYLRHLKDHLRQATERIEDLSKQ